MAQKEHVSGHRVAKVVCVMADGRPVELILPASRRVRLDLVQELLGAREVRLATEEELCRHVIIWATGNMPTGEAERLRRRLEIALDEHLRANGGAVILPGPRPAPPAFPPR